MKKLFKRIFVGTISIALFASCSPTKVTTETNKTEAPVAKEQETKETTETTAEKGVNPIGTIDSKVKVTMIMKDVSPTEEDTELYASKIEEGMAKIGQYVDIQYEESPAGSYKDAVPLAVRTGQISPDIIYFQGGDKAIAEEGLLEDLTPYIASSTYVKGLMQEHNVKRMANYPYLMWLAPVRIPVPVIRGDVLNSLESGKTLLSDPTVDNYYKLFKDIKALPGHESAITADGDVTRFDSVFNHAFGVTASFLKVDNKWISSKVSQGEKDKLEFYSKLYAEGILDKEYITNAWDTMEQKFYENKTGIIAGTAGGTMQVYNDKMVSTNGEASSLVVLPPAKGISDAYLSVDNTKEIRGFAIHADSEVKDAAFAIFEYLASPEGRILDKLGVEGVHYNITDGKLVTTSKFSTWWSRGWDTLYKLEPPAPYEKQPFSKAMLDSLTMTEQYYFEDVTTLIPEELSSQWDAMTMLYKEYSADIIRGVKPISSFDELVTKWNAAGGDELSTYLETVLK